MFLLQWGYRVFANFHSAPAPPKSIKIPRNSKDSNQVEWEPCHLPSLLLEDLSSNSVFFVTMVLRTDTSSRHSYSSAFFISLFPHNSLLFFDASSLKRRTNESPPIWMLLFKKYLCLDDPFGRLYIMNYLLDENCFGLPTLLCSIHLALGRPCQPI